MSKRKHTTARMKRIAIENLRGKSANEIAASIKNSKLTDPTWKDLKSLVYASYGYHCMKCGFLPSDKKNSNVDHIKPRKFYPELSLDFNNLQVLCGRCNKEKSNGPAIDYREKCIDAADEFSDHNLSQFLMTIG